MPGMPLLTTDKIIAAARDEAAKGWMPGQMWMESVQQAWEERYR
jgi:hypothetical protein